MSRSRPRAPIHWRDELADLTRRYDRAKPKRGDPETNLHERERERVIERLADLVDERGREIVGWLLDQFKGPLPEQERDRAIDTAIADAGSADHERDMTPRIALANRVMGTFRSLRDTPERRAASADPDPDELADLVDTPQPVSELVTSTDLDCATIARTVRSIVVLPSGECLDGARVRKVLRGLPDDTIVDVERYRAGTADARWRLVARWRTPVGSGRIAFTAAHVSPAGFLRDASHPYRIDDVAIAAASDVAHAWLREREAGRALDTVQRAVPKPAGDPLARTMTAARWAKVA